MIVVSWVVRASWDVVGPQIGFKGMGDLGLVWYNGYYSLYT